MESFAVLEPTADGSATSSVSEELAALNCWWIGQT